MNERYLTYEVLGECIDGIIYNCDKEYGKLGHGENYLIGMIDMYVMLKYNDYTMGMTEVNALEYLIKQANGAIENLDVNHRDYELIVEDLQAEIEVLTKAINELYELLDKCADELINN